MNRILLMVLGVFCLCQVHGVSQTSVPASVAVEVRPFDTAAIAEYRDKEAYQYGAIEGESVWQIIRRRIVERLNDWFMRKDGTYSVAVILGVLAILLVAMVLILNYRHGVMSAKNTQRSRELALFDQDVKVETLPERIAQCETAQDLAGAFRYRFLLLLTQLDGASVIKARRYKTNGDYRREVSQNRPGMEHRFNKLADRFDYIFYGDHQLDLLEYESLNAIFESFNTRVAV